MSSGSLAFFLALRLHPAASFLAGSESCQEPQGVTFQEFVKQHGRSYEEGSDEYKMREAIFERSKATVRDHNCAPSPEWTLSVNHLADWTVAEIKGLRGYVRGARPESPAMLVEESRRIGLRRWNLSDDDEQAPLPETFSWGRLHAIRKSVDQGNCGSCWALAAERAMSAQSEIHGHQQDFDAQDLVACTPNPHHCGGTGGCNGATAALALEYVIKFGVRKKVHHKGFGARLKDRFHGSAGKRDCHKTDQARGRNTTRAMVRTNGLEVHTPLGDGYWGPSNGISAWVKIAENRLEPLMRAVVEIGPVVISVAAGDGWNFYHKGIMGLSACDQGNVLNHAVVLYGFGATSTKKYWRIKNSWGDRWGEAGAVRMLRLDDEESHCGWDKKPQDGSGCDGGPEKVWVCGGCGLLYDNVVPSWDAL